ncbi:MAG TPA: ABC transporter permease [Ktedonosporobacter sp.]|nr:ABC transporter permease [Ktedonosporobacter sp.]
MDIRDQNPKMATSPEELMPDTGSVIPPADLLDLPNVPTLLREAEDVLQKRGKEPESPLKESLKRLRRDLRAMVSLGVFIFLIVLAIIGPPIYKSFGATYASDLGGPIGPSVYRDYAHQELSKQDQGPSAQYILGTDSLGRDLLSRLMQGLLISMVVAFLVEVVDIGLGVTIGVLAGYYGGWIDQLLARFTDLVFAFPGLLFIILLTGIFGNSADDYFAKLPVLGSFLGNGNARLVIVSLALATVIWPLMARYVRGQTLQLKQQQFVEAARTSGTSDFTIIWRHIIPNLFSIVFIASTLNVANTIIGEAGISLLGLGVQPPGSSLGLMISDTLDQVEVHPWEVLFPTIVLTIIVLAISFLGDGLRDAFDPRSKD